MNNTSFKFYTTPPPPLRPNSPRSNREGAVRSKNYIAFLEWQDFHCQGTKGYMWPYFLGLFYYFSSKSKKRYWIEKHLKQNRFTRHCSRNTKILRFIELQIFLSNSPSKKQGHIWPGQWEIGLKATRSFENSWTELLSFSQISGIWVTSDAVTLPAIVSDTADTA